MSEQENKVARALAKGEFCEALALLGFGDNYLTSVIQGPPRIPAFSRKKKSRSTLVSPSRPKIYGPPPFPAFQRRNLQNDPRYKPDPALFLNYSREMPGSPTPGVPYYHLLQPGRFFPNIVIFPPSPTFAQPTTEDVTPKLTAVDSGDHGPALEVLKAVQSKVSAPSSVFMDISLESDSDVSQLRDEKSLEAILSTSPTSSDDSVRSSDDTMTESSSLGLLPFNVTRSSTCSLLGQRNGGDIVVEDKHLSVMFSTDTFNESSASSCQEICFLGKTDNETTTCSYTAVPRSLSSNTVSPSAPLGDATLPSAASCVAMLPGTPSSNIVLPSGPPDAAMLLTDLSNNTVLPKGFSSDITLPNNSQKWSSEDSVKLSLFSEESTTD